MVYFIADAESIRPATVRIASDYPGLESRVRFAEYSQLLSLGSLPSGTYIFTGTMLFGESQRQLSILAEKELLSRPTNFRVLNSPLRGQEARPIFESLSPGKPLPRARTSDFEEDVDFYDRFNTESSATGIDAELRDDDWSFVASLVLNGAVPEHQAISPAVWPIAWSFFYGDSSLNLGTDAPLLPSVSLRFGLDAFSVTYSAEPRDRKVVALSDTLLNLLPSQGGQTELAKAITEAVVKLDTVPHSDPVPIRVGWEEMAKALRLKSPS